jgi:hypothetical protein
VSQTKKALFAEASSTWRVTANDTCGIDGKERTVQADLQIGIQAPTKYRLTGDCFCRWPEAESQRQDIPNYLGLLVLGWSYILSARLVEVQGQEGAKIVYTDSKAPGYHLGAEGKFAAKITIDIGEVDEGVARWWAAILAPNQGWKAIVSQRDDETYQAPWSISFNETQPIHIKWRKSESLVTDTTGLTPPSSYEALGLLATFSSLYSLGSQFSASLATALTLPTHNYYGTIAQLPFPTQARRHKGNTPAQKVERGCVTISKELPYYMALSCSPSVVISSLCGVFWDIEVPCNLVSPWLHPIINEVPNGKGIISIPGRYHEILVFVCAIRCPPLSALWLGAAISGLVPRVLKFVESGTPHLDHNAFPWTGCPQSFMDVTEPGPYFCPNSSDTAIERADVWQIRYLPPVIDDDLYYEHRPFAPWKPAGKTDKHRCDLRVRAHQDCQRHDISYRHWNWKLKDGSAIEDQGFRMTTTQDVLPARSPKVELLTDTVFPTVPLSLDQNASQNASRTILQWATVNGEGVPSEGIYYDEWVQGFLQDDDDESLSDASSMEAINSSDIINQGDSEWKATLGQLKQERILNEWFSNDQLKL